MEPSFTLLFKRGKYRTVVPGVENTDSEQDKEEREKRREAERFLVAATAFCIKHDRVFRSHFLTSICDLPDKQANSPFRLLVEPHRWGDLVLTSPQKDSVFVVEFKIRHSLQDWQNPESPDFEQRGYGRILLTEFARYKHIRYVVFGSDNRPLALPSGRRIEYAQKKWADLARSFPHSRPLAADFYDCAADLGVSFFKLERTKQMKLGKNATHLASAMALLPQVELEAGLDERTPKFEISYSDKEGWYFGLNIRQSNKLGTLRSELQSFVNPKKGPTIGWYGYAGDDANSSFFSFWFYSADHKSRKRVKQRLLKNGIVPELFSKDESEHTFVEIIAPMEIANSLEGDRQWFTNILKAAMAV
jgi:hypothetical protein